MVFNKRQLLNTCLNPIKRKLANFSLPDRYSYVFVFMRRQWIQFVISLQRIRIKLARWFLWGIDFYVIGGIPERMPRRIKPEFLDTKSPIPMYSIMQPIVRSMMKGDR